MNLSKINTIRPSSNAYVKRLTEVDEAPDKLYYRGKLPEDRRPSVAIVGSRKPTKYGQDIGYKFAYELAEKGIVVISGLAFGVDAIAHKAALDAGGVTLAILASHPSEITPHSHKSLGERIISSGGAIISEVPTSETLRPHHFLKRNRLVSGLADAVIIVEAAQRSGTLSTATHALNQGRTVFAVPGNITSPLSVGCNRLISQGAIPLLSADDILQEIAPELLSDRGATPLGSTPLENLIIKYIASGTQDGELLLELTKASPAKFSQALTMLELADIVQALGGNNWRLR